MDDVDKLEQKILKKQKAKTKLEEEKESKLKVGELEEELDLLGQESEEKAAKWVIETENKNVKERKDVQDDIKEFLNDKQRFNTYEYYLAKLLYKAILGSVEWPKGFKWRSIHNTKGIALVVIDPKGQYFSKGFKPVHHPEYDLNALSRIYWACEDLIDNYEKENIEQNKSSGNHQRDQESQEADLDARS